MAEARQAAEKRPGRTDKLRRGDRGAVAGNREACYERAAFAGHAGRLASQGIEQ